MAKGKTSSKTQQAHYLKYKAENRHSANKKRRMARHLNSHPNDEQTRRVLKDNDIRYTRNNRGDSPGVSKLDLEKNNKTTLGKRKLYDSKGFIIKPTKVYNVIHTMNSIKSQLNKLGIERGRDFNRKIT